MKNVFYFTKKVMFTPEILKFRTTLFFTLFIITKLEEKLTEEKL